MVLWYSVSINSGMSVVLGSNGAWWKVYQTTSSITYIFYSFHNLFADIYKTKAYNRQIKWHMFRSIQLLFISNYEFRFAFPYHAMLVKLTNSWINRLTHCAPIDSSHSLASLFGYDVWYTYILSSICSNS